MSYFDKNLLQYVQYKACFGCMIDLTPNVEY